MFLSECKLYINYILGYLINFYCKFILTYKFLHIKLRITNNVKVKIKCSVTTRIPKYTLNGDRYNYQNCLNDGCNTCKKLCCTTNYSYCPNKKNFLGTFC